MYLFKNLKTWMCRVVVLTLLTVSLEPLAQWRNKANFSSSSSSCYGRYCSELVKTMSFSWFYVVNFPKCYRDVNASSLFPYTTRLWDSLSVECWSLTCGLSYGQTALLLIFTTCSGWTCKHELDSEEKCWKRERSFTIFSSRFWEQIEIRSKN